MRRRKFITLLGGAAVACPLAAFAAGPARLIGVLMGYSENDPAAQSQLAAFGGVFSAPSSPMRPIGQPATTLATACLTA